ncbi:MAG TPA: carboxypeptidase regulatory-like domain-containing protein [Gemmatimonadaceae bacterium]
MTSPRGACRAVIAVVSLLASRTLNAQSVHGSVTARADGGSVGGAVVQLLNKADSAVARALTRDDGSFRLSTSAAGTYRVRTLRIGNRPQVSAPIKLDIGQDLEVSIAFAAVAVSLDTVRVAGRNSCRAYGDTVVATYAIWEQIRGALTAAQLTAASRELTATLMSYERAIDPTFKTVRRQSTNFGVALSGRPWRSMGADSLQRFGYVVDDVNGGRVFMAPDLDVLLSSDFLEDHCMRLARASGDSLIGIEFEPNKDRSSIPEIRGTVWVDRATAEARRMDFTYENLSVAESDARPGGQMEFLRLKNGAWLIARWNIRMPVVTMASTKSGSRSQVLQNQALVNEIRVAGGELISVLKGSDTTWARAPLALSGAVLDSASRDPVKGARLTLRGTSLAAVSDKDGKFSIANVLPGEYGLDVRTASLDSVGGTYATTVTFADASTRVRVSVPSGDAFASQFCPSAADSTKVFGYLLGTVALEGDTTPPWNLAVTAQWQDGKKSVSTSARTDASGTYRMCGVPVGKDIAVRSDLDDTSSAPMRLKIPAKKRFALADIRIPKPAVVVGALFAGSVEAEWSRAPLADAEVVIADLNLSVRTNAQGRFRISSVAPGVHKVSARKVGYAASEQDVTFAGTAPVVRQFLLGGVVSLDPVAVTARPLLPDFEEHRALAAGKFLTRAELAKMEGRTLPQILRELNSVDLVQGRGPHAFPRSSRQPRVADPLMPKVGGNEDNVYCPETLAEKFQGVQCQCYAQVYLDKMLMNPGRPTTPFDANSFQPEQLEAVEWYPSQSEMPIEYQKRGATCGVLVLHTRRSKY